MSVFPQLAVGAVILHNDCVLLVQRANPPNAGQWAIPGGKIRAGETLQQAAEREIFEETGITIRAGEPVFSFDLIERDETDRLRYHYVIVDLLAEYISGQPEPADDALAADWIALADLDNYPVNPTTRELLKRIQANGYFKPS